MKGAIPMNPHSFTDVERDTIARAYTDWVVLKDLPKMYRDAVTNAGVDTTTLGGDCVQVWWTLQGNFHICAFATGGLQAVGATKRSPKYDKVDNPQGARLRSLDRAVKQWLGEDA